jgi:hypothetical protein
MTGWKQRLRALEAGSKSLGLEAGAPCLSCFPPVRWALLVQREDDSVPTCTACGVVVNHQGRRIAGSFQAILLPGEEPGETVCG